MEKKALTILMDFDDILVNFSELFYSFIRKNWRYFSKYFADKGLLTNKELQDRECFDMNMFLLKKEAVDGKTSEEYAALAISLWQYELQTFFETDFYKNAELTELSKHTLLNDTFMNNDQIGQVIILSRSVSHTQALSKAYFINKNFNHEKISFLDVRPGESKLDVIKRNNIDWDVFFDDELSNIRDFVNGSETLKEKTFYIPMFGYNYLNNEDINNILEKEGTFRYYDHFNFNTFKFY